MAKSQAELNEKKQLNRELIEELKDTKKRCQDNLTKQCKDMIVSIQHRDVCIAILQGNLEKQTDSMNRLKDLFLEKIVKLKHNSRRIRRIE